MPADHPDKSKEGGSQPTPGAFIDWLVDVVEALDRVLAPHGSMVIELGDTYAGTGGAGGDWSDSPMTTKARVPGGSNGGPTKRDTGSGWPADKSLTLIPELFRMTLVYGFNPLTGRQTRRWRLRNVIRWVRPNPPVGALCVDDQTEALTLDGWRRHDQLRDGDLIASYDLKTDSIRFLPATFVRYEREGEPMVVIDKKATSQWFTEWHRCLVRTRKGGVQVRLAQDLTNDCDTLLCAPFEDVSGPAPLTMERAALLGWFITEGTPHHRQARIVQSLTANPDKVERIRRLLDADGADYRETTYRRTSGTYGGSVMTTFTIKGELAEWLNLHHKRLPMSYVTTWPEAQAVALFDGLIDGDGHRRKSRGVLFHQKDEAVADAVQVLAIRLGYRASKSWQPSMNLWQITMSMAPIKDRRWTKIRKWEGEGIRREVYTGTVWCPQVETGFWLARRNGKTFITGNSDKFRPATSELMVFCRTDEAGRRRYFDLDAVREPHRPHRRLEAGALPEKRGSKWDEANAHRVSTDYADTDTYTTGHPAGAPPLDWWNIPLLDGDCETCGGHGLINYGPDDARNCDVCGGSGKRGATPYGPKVTPRDITKGIPNRALRHSPTKGNSWGDNETKIMYENPNGAPPLDWWEIPPGGYQGAHYAVFPEALCVRPIKAMCPEKVCRTCGEPSRRIVEDSEGYAAFRLLNGPRPSKPDAAAQGAMAKAGVSTTAQRTTLGWSDCGHDNYRPGMVLDPFAGSGTTLAVAVGHGRDAIGIDLDERNLELARGRLGMFLEAAS